MMNGFDNSNDKATHPENVDAPLPRWSDVTPEQINAVVAEAHRMRDRQLLALIRQAMQTVSSLWRRPGRLIPDDHRRHPKHA